MKNNTKKEFQSAINKKSKDLRVKKTKLKLDVFVFKFFWVILNRNVLFFLFFKF